MSKTKKKEKTFLEKVEEKLEETAKKVAKEAKDIEEKVVEKVKEAVESLEEDKDKKEKVKKTPKKKESKEEQEKSEKEEKLAKLKEKAKKLASSIKTDDSDLKKRVRPDEEEKKDTLIPIEDYLKSSIHLGTRAITPDMKPFVYKRRADSLAVFNTTLLDQRMKEAGEYLSQFSPEDIIVVCKREAGEKAVQLFSKTLEIKAFTKNYPAGILTNPNLATFIETELLFICDPWTDKAALDDAKRIKIPVMAICDTNNYTIGVDFIIPGNNKSSKSLGMILYLLTKLYVEKRKLKVEIPPISEWIDCWDSLVPPK